MEKSGIYKAKCRDCSMIYIGQRRRAYNLKKLYIAESMNLYLSREKTVNRDEGPHFSSFSNK